MKFEITPREEWGLGDASIPLGIAGPCSAESEEQVMETAQALQHKNVHVFRAGIWKPRTRPGTFEGIGVPGLKWLQRVKDELGIPVATEVASAEHVKLALAFDVDVLWIGARTSVNPFAVQEIADALKGTDKVVLVKNPINPDLELWIGAMERLNKVGITKLGAIHRGFSSYEKSKYRNAPQWQIPIELRRRHPEIPIICDPSHIGGRRDMILPVSQMALNMEFDGLMIETHRSPEDAWSDAAQQVTPERMIEITEQLELRRHEIKESEALHKLEQLRSQIDDIDHQIIQVMAERMRVAQHIGEVKRDKNVAILQSNRWEELLDRNVADGLSVDLSEKFIRSIYAAIHDESINKQNNLMNFKVK